MSSKIELNKKIQELERKVKTLEHVHEDSRITQLKIDRLLKCEKTAVTLLQLLIDEDKIKSKRDVELIEFFLTESKK